MHQRDADRDSVQPVTSHNLEERDYLLADPGLDLGAGDSRITDQGVHVAMVQLVLLSLREGGTEHSARELGGPSSGSTVPSCVDCNGEATCRGGVARLPFPS